MNHQARDAVSWSEAQAVDSITYDMLETALEVNAEWHSDGDGGWSVAEPTQSVAGAAGAALLEERRKQMAQGVTRERELAFLVQLLHDPAYALLPLHQKLHQLHQLLLCELARAERAARTRSEPPPPDSWPGNVMDKESWQPFAPASSAHNPGRIDSGGWTLGDYQPHPNVKVAQAARVFDIAAADMELEEEGAATDWPGDEPARFRLRRSVCKRGGDGGGARERDEQTFAFFLDTQAFLKHAVLRAGMSKAARMRVLLDQLAPVVRADETSWENAREYTTEARRQQAALREHQSRAAIREDMAIWERALEGYACSVLIWRDGDPDPPPLQQVLEHAYAEMQSVLKPTLRALIPDKDRSAREKPISLDGERGEGEGSEGSESGESSEGGEGGQGDESNGSDDDVDDIGSDENDDGEESEAGEEEAAAASGGDRVTAARMRKRIGKWTVAWRTEGVDGNIHTNWLDTIELVRASGDRQ